jgi:hypothetical protein
VLVKKIVSLNVNNISFVAEDCITFESGVVSMGVLASNIVSKSIFGSSEIDIDVSIIKNNSETDESICTVAKLGNILVQNNGNIDDMFVYIALIAPNDVPEKIVIASIDEMDDSEIVEVANSSGVEGVSVVIHA